jgi:6-phospho-3-hexuloisomerase
MATYKELVAKVIDENKRVLDRIDEKEIETLIDAIMNAKQIQIFAMGRMKLSAHGFAMRLMHLGFNVHFVFDVTCPKIGKGDLLIVNCAVTTISLGIMKLAKEAGAKVCAITAYPENEHGKLADFTVKIPGQIFNISDEEKTIQPMASLMEQALVLFEDIVGMLMMEKMNVSSKQMEERHTNLEGVLMPFA